MHYTDEAGLLSVDDLVPGKWYTVIRTLVWQPEVYCYKEPVYPRSQHYMTGVLPEKHAPLCLLENGAMFLFLRNKVIDSGHQKGIWSFIGHQDIFCWADFDYISPTKFKEVNNE